MQYLKVPNITPFRPRTFFLLCIFPEVTRDILICIDLGLAWLYTFHLFLKPLLFFSNLLQCHNVHGGSQRGDDHPDPELSSQEPADTHNAILGETAKQYCCVPDTIILTLLNRYLADHLFHCQQMSILIENNEFGSDPRGSRKLNFPLQIIGAP